MSATPATSPGMESVWGDLWNIQSMVASVESVESEMPRVDITELNLDEFMNREESRCRHGEKPRETGQDGASALHRCHPWPLEASESQLQGPRLQALEDRDQALPDQAAERFSEEQCDATLAWMGLDFLLSGEEESPFPLAQEDETDGKEEAIAHLTRPICSPDTTLEPGTRVNRDQVAKVAIPDERREDTAKSFRSKTRHKETKTSTTDFAKSVFIKCYSPRPPHAAFEPLSAVPNSKAKKLGLLSGPLVAPSQLDTSGDALSAVQAAATASALVPCSRRPCAVSAPVAIGVAPRFSRPGEVCEQRKGLELPKQRSCVSDRAADASPTSPTSPTSPGAQTDPLYRPAIDVRSEMERLDDPGVPSEDEGPSVWLAPNPDLSERV